MAKKKICPWCEKEISDFLQICPNCKFIYEKSRDTKEEKKEINISNIAMELQLKRIQEKIKEKKKKRDLNRLEHLEKKRENIKESMKDYKKKGRKSIKSKKIKLLPWEYPKNNSANKRYQEIIKEQNEKSKKVLKELKEKWIDPNELEVIPHSKLWPKWY